MRKCFQLVGQYDVITEPRILRTDTGDESDEQTDRQTAAGKTERGKVRGGHLRY